MSEQLTDSDLWDGKPEESLTVGERKEIDLADFAWPEERKYPIDSQDHLDAAAKLIGHAPENKQAEIKRNAIRIARRHGFVLPDSWKEEKVESRQSTKFGYFQESNQPGEPIQHGRGELQESFQKPQKKIGTLPISWLKYNARSLNQRIYPPATCDAIFKAAQKCIEEVTAIDGLPPTTYVSHEDANGNVNAHLVGGPVKVWQKGETFWTNIDLADTSVARDMLGLAEGGYLKSASMRVAGLQLVNDRNYDLPLVVVQPGVEVQFLGIDLTTRPGLADTARIASVLYESNGQEPYHDVFMFESFTESTEEEPMASIPIYIQIILGMLQEDASKEAHMRVHDHVAGVLDECMGSKHGQESARLRAAAQLDEAGRALAMKHVQRLAAAHDESAHQCGMKCEGCYKEAFAPSDTDKDGDNPAAGDDPDNDGESAHTPPAVLTEQKEKTLTPEEMIAELQKQGFVIQAPKTDKELLAEQAVKLAALEAKVTQLSETAPTQRQTQAPSQLEESSTLQEEAMYQEGDYLAGDLAPKNWRALSNRRVPWPKDLDPKLALHEMAPFLAHTLNMQEANARGRSIDAFIQPNEIM